MFNFKLPSTSISSNISRNSSTRANCPNERITLPNSSFVIEPSPSLSNKRNASRNSEIGIYTFIKATKIDGSS